MGRRAALAVGVYAALVISLVTPLYEPLDSGDDDWWAVLVLLAAAHVGLGAAAPHTWVLMLPTALSVVWFIADGATGFAWMALTIGAPALVGLTALGIVLGHLLGRRSGAVAAAGFFSIALMPAVWAAAETARRGSHVPAAVQRQLPIEMSLGNLCPGASTPDKLERDIRRRAEVLIRELQRRPNDLVSYTYYYSDGADDERRDITVRELAEEQLADLESGGPNCAPELASRIRNAL
jgi:hypothetical protein